MIHQDQRLSRSSKHLPRAPLLQKKRDAPLRSLQVLAFAFALPRKKLEIHTGLDGITQPRGVTHPLGVESAVTADHSINVRALWCFLIRFPLFFEFGHTKERSSNRNHRSPSSLRKADSTMCEFDIQENTEDNRKMSSSSC